MKDLIRLDDLPTEELESEGFGIYRGWSADLANQLVERSREPEMLRWVPRDAAERFIDAESAHEWHRRKKRTVYALAHRAILGGVIWFGEARNDGCDASHTFAIRMYEETRGRHLAGRFMAAAHRDFEASPGHSGGIWLETDENNLAALRLYEGQGYTKIKISDEGRILMVRGNTG